MTEFVDIRAQHDEVDGLQVEVQQELACTNYVLGEAVEAFEGEFARYIDDEEPPECIGVGSGTEALEIALRACGIGTGDRVLVPAFTFVATGEAVARVGAEPVFADVDRYGLMRVSDLVSVADDIDAVVPVHLYGKPHPHISAIRQIAEAKGAVVIEDAAQAHGAFYENRDIVGSSAADATIFSFYPSKNLGAAGDAGAVVTRDEGVAEQARKIRNHGGKGNHDVLGLNGRMDSIQAAILRAKLPHLDPWNGQRYHVAAAYEKSLSPLYHRLPHDYRTVWHLYPVIVPGDRDELATRLEERGVPTGTHYPYILPDLGAFSNYDDQPLCGERRIRGDMKVLMETVGVDPSAPWPMAHLFAEGELSLPIHPYMDFSDVHETAEVLNNFL